MGDSALRLAPPPDVVLLAGALETAGYETWCVGGAVRDSMLGLQHLDWDLATAATPREMRRVFGRVIPVGEEFGTLGVFGAGGTMYEVTTFRRDVRTDGRHAEVEFGASLDEDLARRDFTINAIAFSPTKGILHDPFDGQGDLKRRLVKAVGLATDRMREDRLRALRALRFAGRFDFEIEPSTWRAIIGSATALGNLSQERIQQELVKTMDQVALPSRALGLWRASGALEALLPMLVDAPQWRFRAADLIGVPDRTRSPAVCRRRRFLRIAALFAGSPAAEAERCLRHLRFANRDAAVIADRVRAAGAIGSLAVEAMTQGPVPDRSLRQWAAIAGRPTLADALRVVIAANLAEDGADRERAATWASIYRRAVRIAYREPVEIADLAVDGEDLQREVGVPPGRSIGALLRALLAWVVDDPARNVRDLLISQARELHGHGQGG
jgi:tRNA nucleotidyltransferase (CCA-adding enzyme)